LEAWGGATFDACIRYLGEDPWERLRRLKQSLPRTPLQMLLRGQNLLGYRHYADDVVEKFVERAAFNGVDVFRIFDALNDERNFRRAIEATVRVGRHAQAAISFTVSPVHTVDMWVDLSRRLEDMGAHSVCIKDMAGLLKPYVAEELIGRLKAVLSIPVHMQCHATTGLSTATIMKAVEAGLDNVDTAISSMSMTYGHSPTEAVVAMFEDHPRATGLDLKLLEEIALYFRSVRKKYASFEGSLRGVDSRILVAQIPGGMLTNLESQLKEQGALSRLDEVMAEIPVVRRELGYIPLVTPTSQIVGTQAVINVMSGERYKTITKETAGVLRGEYGATPAPVDSGLQHRALGNSEAIHVRPADLLAPELGRMSEELTQLAREHSVRLAHEPIDDVLTYAMFPQVGWRFLQHRHDPSAFEPAPGSVPGAAETREPAAGPATSDAIRAYSVKVNGSAYHVEIGPGDSVTAIVPQQPMPAVSSGGETVRAPMAGLVLRIAVREGQQVAPGDIVVVMEAMKMETEVRARLGGLVASIAVKAGDNVGANDALVTLS
ncbi:MAG: pyruvate carboxylase subunit B, partial [Gammaproteobacteria bacterium]|nr:pyruvate carboxylase subunit B [Gammaproteobacteria bacterium]